MSESVVRMVAKAIREEVLRQATNNKEHFDFEAMARVAIATIPSLTLSRTGRGE